MPKANSYKIIMAAFLISALISCEKEVLPDAPILTTPSENSACVKGVLETENTVHLLFTWNNANYAKSYQLDIRNLLTQTVTTYNTNETSYNAVLQLNTPYSWSVTSKNDIGSMASKVWKFYLSGEPTSSYAPFPADLTYPFSGTVISSNGASTYSVTFQWKTVDLDNDIVSYAFYLDDTNATTLVSTSVTTATYTQSLHSGKNYYWKIVTNDKSGNSSISAVSIFYIN